MRRCIIGLALCASVAPGVWQPGSTEPEQPREPGAWDLANVDDLAEKAVRDGVARLYASISGPPGARDFQEFKSLFDDEGRLIAVAHGASGDRIVRMTPDDWIARSGPGISENGFFESEVASRVELFGHIAHAWSTYESRRTPEADPFASGINSIQLIKDPADPAASWRILTVLWDSQTDEHAIPERYRAQD
jgi:hypothetical protein